MITAPTHRERPDRFFHATGAERAFRRLPLRFPLIDRKLLVRNY